MGVALTPITAAWASDVPALPGICPDGFLLDGGGRCVRWAEVARPPRGFPIGLITLTDGRIMTVGLQVRDDGDRYGGADEPPRFAGGVLHDPRSWILEPTPPMPDPVVQAAGIARSEHAVFVFDGFVYEPAASLEDPPIYRDVRAIRRFDLTTRTWTRLERPDDLATAYGFLQLPDGQVLLAGGHRPDNEREAVADTWRFDPVGETWSPGPPLGSARVLPRLAALADGRILCFGGVTSTEADVWTPSGETEILADDDTWRAQPEKPGGRHGTPPVTLRDGRVLGFATSEPESPPRMRFFDPSDGSWSDGLEIPDLLGVHWAVHTADDTVLFGGWPREYETSASLLLYQWRPGEPVERVALDPTRDRIDSHDTRTVHILEDGRVALFSGADRLVEIYDTERRQARALSPAPMTLLASSTDPEGRLLLLGERRRYEEDRSTASWIVQRRDLDGTWTQPSALDAAEDTGIRAFALQPGHFVLLGDTCQRYDTASGWGACAAPPVIPWNAAAAVMTDGSLVFAGGGTDEQPSAESHRYDPRRDRWTQLGDLLTPRVGASLAALPDGSALLVSGRAAFEEDESAWKEEPVALSSERLSSRGRWREAAPTPIALDAPATLVLPSGEVACSGRPASYTQGRSATGGRMGPWPQDTVPSFLWDPDTDSWRDGPRAPPAEITDTPITWAVNDSLILQGGGRASLYAIDAGAWAPTLVPPFRPDRAVVGERLPDGRLLFIGEHEHALIQAELLVSPVPTARLPRFPTPHSGIDMPEGEDPMPAFALQEIVDEVMVECTMDRARACLGLLDVATQQAEGPASLGLIPEVLRTACAHLAAAPSEDRARLSAAEPLCATATEP